VTFDEVVRHFGARPSRDGYEARCPSNFHVRGDQSWGLSISAGEDGRTLVHCHAGCETVNVLAAVGLSMADLFVTSNGSTNGKVDQPHLVATYEYLNADGTPAYYVHRYHPKDFRQQAPDGTWKTARIPKVLYHLPEVIAAVAAGQAVAICEGEKDADLINNLGTAFGIATCNPGGALKWSDEYAQVFAGAERVAVMVDNDPPGRAHAARVARSAAAVGVKDLRVFLPAVGKDVGDHLQAKLRLTDLIRVEDWQTWPTEPTPEPRFPPSLADFLAAAEVEDYDWVVPDLLERGDRGMLTGKEGYGKSTLLRQIGVAAAAGIHPFTFKAIPALRVLNIDCENSKRQLRRELTKVLMPLATDDRMADVQAHYFVEVRSDGLVLDLAHDPLGDREWLEATIVGARPDLVILGPVYKIIEGDPLEEPPNRGLVKFLDRLRTRYGFAILLEAHTPHEANRPYGWSGWKRWPEFGLHLTEDGQLERWRGDRDERAWPERLVRGKPGAWLWTPAGAVEKEPPQSRNEKAVGDAQVAVLAVMRRARKPLTKPEVLDRTGCGRNPSTAAFNRLLDRKAFKMTTEERPDSIGRTCTVELYEIDPDGPFSATP